MKAETSAVQAAEQLQTARDEYLTFMLADEEYGVDILRVQGIQGWSPVTPIPRAPEFVLGVTNLRGAVVPIIDLRKRFGIAEQEFGPTTVVIVVNVEDDSQRRVMGMVVDGVSEVYALDSEAVQPPPDFGCSVDTSFIRGLSTVDERMLILLDIDRLLNETVRDSAISEPTLEAIADAEPEPEPA